MHIFLRKNKVLLIVTALFSLAVAAFATGCTFTFTRPKPPEFKSDTALRSGLDSLVQCQHLNITGEEVSAKGKTSAIIKVEIINAVNTPAMPGELQLLAKSVAKEVKGMLTDTNEYNVYEVYFIKQQTTGAVTRSHSERISFQSGDL